MFCAAAQVSPRNLSSEGVAVLQVCRDTERECCQHLDSSLFFNGIASYCPGRAIQSGVRVMHSSGRQEGREPPVWSSSCPINTFSQLLLHLTLIPGIFPLADMKRPSWIFYRRVGHGCTLRPLMKNREKVRLRNDKQVEFSSTSRLAEGSWQTRECRSLSGRFTACQRLRFEECPPAVRKRGPWEGELDRLRHLFFKIIQDLTIRHDAKTRFFLFLSKDMGHSVYSPSKT